MSTETDVGAGDLLERGELTVLGRIIVESDASGDAATAAFGGACDGFFGAAEGVGSGAGASDVVFGTTTRSFSESFSCGSGSSSWRSSSPSSSSTIASRNERGAPLSSSSSDERSSRSESESSSAMSSSLAVVTIVFSLGFEAASCAGATSTRIVLSSARGGITDLSIFGAHSTFAELCVFGGCEKLFTRSGSSRPLGEEPAPEPDIIVVAPGRDLRWPPSGSPRSSALSMSARASFGAGAMSSSALADFFSCAAAGLRSFNAWFASSRPRAVGAMALGRRDSVSSSQVSKDIALPSGPMTVHLPGTDAGAGGTVASRTWPHLLQR